MTGDSTPTAAVEAVARAIAKRNYASATAVDIDEMWTDFIGDAEVAIAAMPPAIGEQWRPIAEYRGYGAVLVSRPSDRLAYSATTAFLDMANVWRVFRSEGGMTPLPFVPTHLRPLPAPPESVEP